TRVCHCAFYSRPGGEGFGGLYKLLGKGHRVGRRVFGHGKKKSWTSRRYLFLWIVKLTASEQEGFARLLHLRHHHGGRNCLLQLLFPRPEDRQTSVCKPILLGSRMA